jgi:hypothetical protein
MKKSMNSLTLCGHATFLNEKFSLHKLRRHVDQNTPILCNTIDGIPFFLEIRQPIGPSQRFVRISSLKK